MRSSYLGAGPAVLLGVGLGLAACGGSGGGGAAEVSAPTPVPPGSTPSTISARCDSIHGGGAQLAQQVDPGCLDCAIGNAAAAGDDQAGTFAEMAVNSALYPQGAALRATAQDGIVYAAGQRAGAFLTLPDGGDGGAVIQTGISSALELRTYLDGVEQERAISAELPVAASGANAYYSVWNFPGGEELPNQYLFLTASKPYDAVELFYSNNQNTAGADGLSGTDPLQVYELCSDGEVSPWIGR
ncbi:MAG: hypothetical protein Q8Q73_08835 [Stagnimonas sp.]|nr:hypothetical protein [Stagnimonas sp.]